MRGYSALEDVPIIVPIAVALIMFFASFSWAINTVNETNDRVDLALSVIKIADTISGQGVVTESSFKSACDSLRATTKDIYFRAYVTSPESAAKSINTSPCSGSLCCQSTTKDTSGNSVYVRVFPITYQTSSGGVPKNDVNALVVIVWPKG